MTAEPSPPHRPAVPPTARAGGGRPVRRSLRRVLGKSKRLLSTLRPRSRDQDGAIRPIGAGVRERHCRPLIDPPVVPAGQATHLEDDDLVLGLVLDGEARAYPWWIMDNHHVANDRVGSHSVTIVLCEVCSLGMAFEAEVGGRRLTFAARFVYQGTHALGDHETGSVWAPYLGRAIRGELEGTTLRLLPLEHMEWSAWRELHPDTTVLGMGLGSRTGHGARHTIGTAEIGPSFRRSVPNWDQRLPHNEIVLGAMTPAEQRVYPMVDLRARDGVVNDELGGVAIVVLADVREGSYGALAFSRAVDGRTLTFEPGPDGPVDRETGSRWSTRGRALEGSLRGTQLEFVPSHVSEWYPWAANYPDIGIGPNA